ncbi:MAG: response regulator [Planctomycetota bacterium]|nr:response regulator [Planctomycetota bacterium]
MKVLLAEDGKTMRQLLVTQLKGWNYDVTEAEDGAAAWQEFQKCHFPLVLTDWMMPEVDGLELIRRIRASERSEYVYIILLTARSESENLVEAMEAGADDFLVKPCNPKELKVRLRAGERIIELERTLVDQNRQLKVAQAALVQTEKLAGVGQLAAGMAHEINNPIAFVSNNLSVLQRDVQAIVELVDLYSESLSVIEKTDKQLATHLRAVEADCDFAWLKENLPQLFRSSLGGLARVRAIVKNLQDFAHLDEAVVSETDVVAAVESVLAVLTSEMTARELTIRRQFDCQPSIYCQPAQINQALHGILLNAIQASEPKGLIEIGVSQDELSIRIAIKDHGRGMEKTTQQHVFEPFFTTQPVGSGQGLGLAMSYGIIQQHGGSIEFDSAPGKGTTFRVTLPKANRFL